MRVRGEGEGMRVRGEGEGEGEGDEGEGEGEGERKGFTTPPFHTPHPPTTTHRHHPPHFTQIDGRSCRHYPLCPSPPPYYCDLMRHGQHRTPPLTYIFVLGLNVSARLKQHLHYWVMAINCREVQGGVPFLREEWGWGWGEGERG